MVLPLTCLQAGLMSIGLIKECLNVKMNKLIY